MSHRFSYLIYVKRIKFGQSKVFLVCTYCKKSFNTKNEQGCFRTYDALRKHCTRNHCSETDCEFVKKQASKLYRLYRGTK